MQTCETIAALLTPLAPGAIAVVGMTGPAVDRVLGQLLRSASRDEPPVLMPNRPRLCRFMPRGEFVDETIVTLIADSAEPSVEICTHGGVRIAQRVLAELAAVGVGIVSGDEYMDRTGAGCPVQREIDLALIRSQSQRLTRWLLSQRRILPPFLKTLHLLSPEALAAFRRRSEVAIRLIQGIEIALIGPPNAGKSTLANRLIGIDRMITSDMPGTTRDWVSETALIHGWPVILTDTAGMRQTACEIESEAIRRAADRAGRAGLILHIESAEAGDFSATVPSESLQVSGIGGERVLCVWNKIDIVAGVGRKVPFEALGVSALTGSGINILEDRISELLGLTVLQESLPTAVCERQLLSEHR